MKAILQMGGGFSKMIDIAEIEREIRVLDPTSMLIHPVFSLGEPRIDIPSVRKLVFEYKNRISEDIALYILTRVE